MRIEFHNGATVHAMWGELGDGELIAAFQYDSQAKSFAAVEANHPTNPPDRWYLVVDHESGKVNAYRPAKIDKRIE